MPLFFFRRFIYFISENKGIDECFGYDVYENRDQLNLNGGIFYSLHQVLVFGHSFQGSYNSFSYFLCLHNNYELMKIEKVLRSNDDLMIAYVAAGQAIYKGH